MLWWYRWHKSTYEIQVKVLYLKPSVKCIFFSGWSHQMFHAISMAIPHQKLWFAIESYVIDASSLILCIFVFNLTSHDSQCNCWKDFESGKCQGNVTTFSAQNVEPTSYFSGSGKYFAKTDKDGWSLPRSTKQKQFVYQYDTGCSGK